jgi:hypothetical protein
MSNSDKMIAICIVGMWVGFIMILIDVQRHAYKKGLREGWHRGRNTSRQEFWQE